MTAKPSYEELEKKIQELEQAESNRKPSEEELTRSHDLMDYIISHTRSAIAVFDRDFKYIYVSKRYLTDYKVKEQNVIGKHHYEIFPDIPQKWKAVHQRSLAGEVITAEEDPYYREDRSVDWTRWECRPWYESDGSIGGIVIYNEIINERKEIEAALRESEKKYRELSDSLPQVVFEIDETGKIIYVNKNAFDLFMYTKDELDKGLNVIQIIIPEDHDRAIQNMQSVLNGVELGGVEYTALKHDGTTFPVLIHSSLVTRNAKSTGLRGLLIDITEQKKMETDLKRRALAIDYSSDTIMITDTSGTIIYVNPAFEKITGFSRKEAQGKTPIIVKSGKHDTSFYRELWETISNGKTWSGRFFNKKKDGSRYVEDATISPVFSDKGKIVNYVYRILSFIYAKALIIRVFRAYGIKVKII